MLEEDLANIRADIDRIDLELVRLIAERRAAVMRVGKYKKRNSRPVKDKEREVLLINKVKDCAKKYKIDNLEMIEQIFSLLIEDSVQLQENLIGA